MRSDLPTLVSGDFNGDGVADILLGARFGDGPDNSRQDAGEAYVVFGSEELDAAVDVGQGEQDVSLWGAAPGDNLGFSAAAADLNADGIADIAVGAPFAAADGAVYVFFGGPDLPGQVDLSSSPPDVLLEGPGPGSFFGDSLASGDVNGDGMADLIVGATFAASPQGAGGGAGSQTGAVYAISGGSDWPATVRVARGEYDLAVYGAEALDELGDTVASGDINGDGTDDVLMTAEAADGPANARDVGAEVYAVFGGAALEGDRFVARGEQDLTVLGAEAQDTLGFSLAAGDFTGDGIDDLAMGARLDDGPGNQRDETGAVYVLVGSRSLPGEVDLAQNPAGVLTLYGADSGDQMAIANAGDIQEDGTPELLVGSGQGDGAGNQRGESGELYVLGAGALSSLAGPAAIDAVRASAVVFGARPGDQLGTAAAVADVNGDGRPELLVMAADADSPEGERQDVGVVYVVSLAP
ncbi:MAG TPA: hypothetical protein VFX28_13700 [Methylomirabilota bacterium]|nr:hypothetical protein [Methylomirabilota bacterium]